MANDITYENKNSSRDGSPESQWTAANANEVKSVVNGKQDKMTAGKYLVVQCADYNASTTQFPAGGGTGELGAIEKGNQFDIITGSVNTDLVPVGSVIRAKINNPGQDANNWKITQA